MKRIVTVLLAAMMLFSCMQIAAAEEITEAAASEESMGVKQGTEARAEEEPAAEEPAAEEPAAEELAAEEPAAEAPAAEEPAAKAPSDEETAEKPEEPAAETRTAGPAERPGRPAPALTRIEDYETPLGHGAVRRIVLNNMGKATVSFRESPDGMSDVIEELPENTELAILSVKDDWAKAVAVNRVGYVFAEDLRAWLEPEETKEDAGEDMKVTIFSSHRRGMEAGETILLSSRIEGFDGYEIRYQWECDKHDGRGFLDVEGANESEYGFIASADSLSWDWRLSIYYH